MTSLEQSKALDEACRLVGRFLRYYAIMEHELDLAMGKLLGLEEGIIDIIGANIPLFKKVDVLFSAEKFLAAVPEQDREKFLKKTKSGISKLNRTRIIFAHCPFDAGANGGVSFRRVTAGGELKVVMPDYSPPQIESECEMALSLAEDLRRVVAEMKPYAPSLDFSDTRNSLYIAFL